MMKELAFITLISLLVLCAASVATAQPYLVCDPQAGVETYKIYQDGSLIAQNIPAEADGSLRFDMVGIQPGKYEFTAEACNIWGCSTLSDPYQSPAGLTKPAGLKLRK